MYLKLLAALLFSVNSAYAEAPRVVSDIPPIGSLVASVMDGVGTPDVLVRSGASAHHFHLRPSDVRKLSRADLVIWVDDGLTPWLPETLGKVAPDTAVLVLNETDGVTLWPFREDALFAGHADEEDGEEEDGDHDAHAHDDGHHSHDPHSWLDPDNAVLWLGAIANKLAELDPENAAAYRANAQGAMDEVIQLGLEIERRFTTTLQDFFVYHDAFQYFERRFEVLAAGSISAGDASRPGAARIEALRDMAGAAHVSCVFSEPQFSVELIEPIFGETPVKHAVLDPLGSELPLDRHLYGTLLGAISEQIVDCAR